jgi:hypothetical protein
MTGDGSVVGALTSYEFSLHCDPNRGGNRLWVEWGDASGFELTRVTDAVCRDDSEIDPGRPFANFDTYHGEGQGRLDGQEGARAKWMFTDAGEPGGDDQAEIAVYGPDGDLVLEVSGPIARNHQASGKAFLPIEPRIDEDNVMNSVIVDEEARSRDFEQTLLSADAFGEMEQDRKPPVVETTPPKIHPELLLRIQDEDPDTRVEILMNLTEVKVITRWPDHPIWYGCEYDENQDEMVALAIEQENANLQATEEFLARFQDGDHDIQVLEQFWIVNAFAADLRLGDIVALAADDEVQFIEESIQFQAPPPGIDGNPNNDIIDGRARMDSDRWFNQYGTGRDCIGLIDSGVDTGQYVFLPPNPNVRLRGDCAYGGHTCLDSSLAGFTLLDLENHGTASANIISGNTNVGADYRGVTDIRIDSWKVWGLVNSTNFVLDYSVLRAFQQGFINRNRVFAVVLQMKGPHTSPISVAADNAFNGGAVVVAATGNCAVVDGCAGGVGTPRPGTTRSPANAHKALGIGAFNVETFNTGDYQGYGPTYDGRIKPDIQTPTDVETASQCDIANASDPRVCPPNRYTPMGFGRFGGTSAATPFAAGAAALMRNWMRRFNTFDPGHTYARLILSGLYTYPYPERHGAGPIRLPSCTQSYWGKIKVPATSGLVSVVDIPIPVSSTAETLRAALWWPENVGQLHSDIDLLLIDPNGISQAAATAVGSVFERTAEMNPVGGQWKVSIRGHSGLPGRTVYWAADVVGCEAISQKGNPYPPSGP